MSASRGEMLTPNPNECNSTLTSGTNNIYPYPYIDVNDWGHRLGFIQPHRRSGLSLHRSTPSSFKFKQLHWPELKLPIKLFQFKVCQLAVTNDA